MILSQGENLIIIKNEKKNTKDRKEQEEDKFWAQILSNHQNIWFTLVQSKFWEQID